MRLWMKVGIITVFALALLYFGSYLLIYYFAGEKSRDIFNEKTWVNPLNAEGIVDNIELYKDNQQVKADIIYITVFKKTDTGDRETGKFSDLLRYTQDDETADLFFKVYFEDGAGTILDNSIFVREPNAVLELKGKSPGNDIQKSFKITLHDKEGLWYNQKTINLNKHYKDPLRIRNKLAFDYLSIIPDITSFRTRFVRVYIKDLSAGADDAPFIDFGVFTHVEQPNKLFLTNHRLDPNAQLYQAEDFKFLRYPENIKLKTDRTYAKSEFEKVLSIKGNDDHRKLIKMLEAVNDYGVNIDDIVAQYFDKENYLTWLAVNILFDNPEAANTNFLLYSPLNSSKWYFMPWDFDEAWGLKKERPVWQKGIAMYWGNVLHQRFLAKPENTAALNKKIEELGAVINEEQTKAFLDSYYDIIMTNITMLPDIRYLPITIDQYQREFAELAILLEKNRLYYYELQESPMPFLLKGFDQQGNKLIFSWEKSVDLQGDSLTYNFEISRFKDFSVSEISLWDIVGTQVEIERLPSGVYYWRIVAKDTEGHSQSALDMFIDEFGDEFFGLQQCVIK